MSLELFFFWCQLIGNSNSAISICSVKLFTLEDNISKQKNRKCDVTLKKCHKSDAFQLRSVALKDFSPYVNNQIIQNDSTESEYYIC